MTADTDGSRRRGPALRRAAPLVLIAVALVVVGVVSLRSLPGDDRLDPRSSEPSGTRALVLLLREVGADVQILERADGEGLDTMLVMVDDLDDAAARDLTDGSGPATILVTDFGGALAPEVHPAGMTALLDAPVLRDCDVAALRDAETVRTGPAPFFVVPDGATGCYRSDELAWLVVQPDAESTTVVTGGAEWLTNARIRDEDNAQLAVALLAPRPGTRVGVVTPRPAVGGAGRAGRRTLTDLIPGSVRTAFVQLLVAFGFVVLWRARRLGKPLHEPSQVRLPASELVIAMGNLYHRTGARGRAAGLLREDLRRTLSRRLGSGRPEDSDALADAVAARSPTIARDDALDVIAGAAPASDDELVELAQRAEHLRSTVLAPNPSGDHRVPTT